MRPVNLDSLFDDFMKAARVNAAKHGYLESVITGMNDAGIQCHVIQGGNDAVGIVPEHPTVLVLPAPFQAYQHVIREWFSRHKVTIASWVAEVWMYPEGDEGAAAAEAYLSGTGPTPSQHPDRREAATVFLAKPLAGFARLAVLPIVRDGDTATLGDAVTVEQGDDEMLTFTASWLEECLPAPDDRADG